ncbi:family 1 glycosylhydrolase [Thalassobacillus pellis]|uniref:family 1 glycosylhydrolase n=1 Tax=Thalassobacillus pellis TaxID=748008 RepID=UPI00195FBF5A|nr:family 1 glycosylhydrolase [Thalassobacillus pellis]MBM7551460.1 beta-glucosidase/6-phospho-beta-glucosidase/beta-galactosidase [Thalassobacillus pellis]
MKLENEFTWAVGIEDTFVTQVERGERPLDEYTLTQHYQNWKEDLDLARKSGATMIRYGIPWYKVEKEEGEFDWRWVDQVMDYFRENKELVPIIDLMHYGTPHWLKNEFSNGRYPDCVANYAKAFAERYSDIVTHYTPLNEPYVNAEFCGLNGVWPPYQTGLQGFYHLIIQLGKGIIKTISAIKSIDSNAAMVHVDATKKYVTEDDALQTETDLWNENRFVMWELLNGQISEEHSLFGLMMQYGVTPEQLEWFQHNNCQFDIVGINYYPQFSVHEVRRDKHGFITYPHILGTGEEMKDIIREAERRYKAPIMITETSFRGSETERIDWLDESAEACFSLRKEGVNVIGYTWFPFFDLVDWEYRTSGKSAEEELMPFGLYTLEMDEHGKLVRNENRVGQRFKEWTKDR